MEQFTNEKVQEKYSRTKDLQEEQITPLIDPIILNQDPYVFNFHMIDSLFNLSVSRDTIYEHEESGKIPKAFRKGGGGRYRYWTVEDAIKIGIKFSGHKLPRDIQRAIIITIELTKGGGSHKTSYTENFAKYLAMQNYKVLLIPLDFQLNLGKAFGFDNSKTAIKKRKSYFLGLNEVIKGENNIRESIYPTFFPNIDIIPDSINLLPLESYINTQAYREQIFHNTLKPIIKDYDFILFDNNPAWSNLALNSICASSVLIAPIGVDQRSYDTLDSFTETLEKQLPFPVLRDVIFVPGFHEKKISGKLRIMKNYREKLPGLFVSTEIRKSSKMDESSQVKKSIFEFAPRTSICEDYISVCNEVLMRIIENKDTPRQDIKAILGTRDDSSVNKARPITKEEVAGLIKQNKERFHDEVLRH